MNNVKIGITQVLLLIVSMAVVLTVGSFVWGNITGSIDWTDVKYSESYNMTVNNVDTIFNVGPIVFGIVIALIVVVVAIGWASVPDGVLERNRFLKFLVRSLYYFVYGLFGLVCILPVLGLGMFLYDFMVVQGNTGSIFAMLKWLMLIIVAYFSIAGFGYMWKRVVVDRVKKKLDSRQVSKQAEGDK